MKAVLMHNPGLMVTLALLLAGMLVSGLLAAMMAGSGTSLKGIVFFATFFAIAVLPQLAGHLALAVKPPSAKAVPGPVAAPAGPAGLAWALSGDTVRDPVQVFGPAHVHGQRADARALFASRMPGLRVADAVHWPTGDSVTALVFDSPEQAAAGLRTYLDLYQVAPTLDRGGVEIHGSRGLGGGLVQLRRSGAAVLVVTGLSEPWLAARVASLPLLQAASAPGPGQRVVASEPLVPALQPLVRLFRGSVALQVVFLLAMVALASWWFFYGTTWAGRVTAEPGAKPLPASMLRSRLLALNISEVPMTVEQQPDGRIAVTWRWADARWADFAGAHRTVRTHRLLLRLDETSRRVNVTEQSTEFDASVGLSKASLRWRTELGITFFQVDHRRVFGLQLGPDGTPTGALTHTWRFNLADLKGPLMATVTGAGWDWQSVVLDLPALLERGTPALSR